MNGIFDLLPFWIMFGSFENRFNCLRWDWKISCAFSSDTPKSINHKKMFYAEIIAFYNTLQDDHVISDHFLSLLLPAIDG